MGKLSRRKGVEFERAVAAVLGAERTGTRGKEDAEDGDVKHDLYFVQCKRRKSLSIGAWWKETAHGAQKAGKTPLLVVREDRHPALVVLSLQEFVRLTLSEGDPDLPGQELNIMLEA